MYVCECALYENGAATGDVRGCACFCNYMGEHKVCARADVSAYTGKSARRVIMATISRGTGAIKPIAWAHRQTCGVNGPGERALCG